MSETTNNTFDSIFRRYYASLVNYARLMVPADDAKDIVQDVFSWLLKHPGKIREIQSGGEVSYLTRSVYNACLNHLRSKKYDSAYRMWTFYKMEQEYSAYDPDKDPFIRKLFKEDIRKNIDSKVAELPPRSREAFLLFYKEGLSHKTIAEIMGISVSTVENQLYSALRTLREALSGEKKEKKFVLG